MKGLEGFTVETSKSLFGAGFIPVWEKKHGNEGSSLLGGLSQHHRSCENRPVVHE